MMRSASGPFAPLCRNTTQTSRPEEIASLRACSMASMIRDSPVRRAPELNKERHAGKESAANMPRSPRTESNSRREKPFLTGSSGARSGRKDGKPVRLRDITPLAKKKHLLGNHTGNRPRRTDGSPQNRPRSPRCRAGRREGHSGMLREDFPVRGAGKSGG